MYKSIMSKSKIPTHDSIKALLSKLSHTLQVSFALYCAIDANSLIPKPSKESIACIDLVQLWLKDETKVSSKS